MDKEQIKQEAKKYYQGKNMRMRYVFMFFIAAIIAFQFILPRKNNTTHPVETIIDTGMILNTINFLGEKIIIEDAISTNINTIQEYQKTLEENNIDTDLAYVLNYLQENKNNLPKEYLENLIINEKIDQRLDQSMITKAYISYRKDMYKETKSRKLTAIASLIGIDKTREIFVNQKNTSLNDMYFWNNVENIIVQCASEKYAIENSFITAEANYQMMEIKGIENIVQRTKEKNVSNREFRKINPRILTNELPKKDDGKRIIKLPK